MHNAQEKTFQKDVRGIWSCIWKLSKVLLISETFFAKATSYFRPVFQIIKAIESISYCLGETSFPNFC